MRMITLLTIGLFLFTAGCSSAPQEKTITLVNVAAVEAPLLERVRVFAQQELHVPVRAVENPQLASKAGFDALEKAARGAKKDSDIILIVLTRVKEEPRHLAVYPETGIALVNAQPLFTDDNEAFARRIERQVMRAAAFSFGLEPTPDPYCATRDYTSLEDLDSMGRNFSPPWQGRFAEEATKRGLVEITAPIE